jgi:hypothetical protein
MTHTEDNCSPGLPYTTYLTVLLNCHKYISSSSDEIKFHLTHKQTNILYILIISFKRHTDHTFTHPVIGIYNLIQRMH